MNTKVDFAAGGIVVDNNKVLLVKNKKNEFDPWDLQKLKIQKKNTSL